MKWQSDGSVADLIQSSDASNLHLFSEVLFRHWKFCRLTSDVALTRCTYAYSFPLIYLAAVPPKIEVDPRYRVPQEVKQGSTLVLPVSYTAVPRPRTSWYHRGLPLSVRHGHVHIDTGDSYSTLTVLGIESNEGGKYEVAVENLAGVSKFEYDVIVRCKCIACFHRQLFQLLAYCRAEVFRGARFFSQTVCRSD